jgi:antitoxin component of MazEF toxin-antitoxin module
MIGAICAMADEEEQIGKELRRVFKLGYSMAIVLPSEYVKKKGLKTGDLMEIYFDDVIYMKPVDVKELVEKARKVKEHLESLKKCSE